MKAAVYTKYGSPTEVLELREVEKPIPKDNEVLVKVHASSINSWDWDLVRGIPRIYRIMFGLLKPKYIIPGIDIAGKVEAVGGNVKKLKPGDDVFGDISEYDFGGFAEYVCVKENALVLKPENMSFKEAATLPHAGGLAFQGLFEKRQIKKGQKVLINGACGCVGPLAIQMAKLYGAEITAVDSAQKFDVLQSLGVDYLIDYKKEDFTKNGEKYDLIIDLVANRSIFKYKRSLLANGIFFMVGGTVSSILQAGFLGPLISIFSSKQLGILMYRPNKNIDSIILLYEAGKLKPIIDKCFSLSEVSEALQYFGDGHSQGKIVIIM